MLEHAVEHLKLNKISSVTSSKTILPLEEHFFIFIVKTLLASTQPMTLLLCVLYLCPLTGPVCMGRRRKWLY